MANADKLIELQSQIERKRLEIKSLEMQITMLLQQQKDLAKFHEGDLVRFRDKAWLVHSIEISEGLIYYTLRKQGKFKLAIVPEFELELYEGE